MIVFLVLSNRLFLSDLMLAEDDVSDDDRDSEEGVLSFNFLFKFFFFFFFFFFILSFLLYIWCPTNLDLNLLKDLNFFKVKFESLEDFQQLLRDEPCFIGNLRHSETSFSSVVVWVRLLDLPIESRFCSVHVT